MKKEELRLLAEKILQQEASDEEIGRYNSWFNAFQQGEDLAIDQSDQKQQLIYSRIQHLIKARKKAVVRKLILRFTSAAAALLIIGFGLFFIVRSSKLEVGRIAGKEILPGYNQATLTLADGSTVKLDSAQSGIIIQDEDIKYTNGNSLPGVILPAPSAVSGSVPDGSASRQAGTGKGDVLLQLTTPKGGQYQIILSDGTKVWLNAASTLKYPSKFTGDTREVFLEGEAYFQVRKSESPKDGKTGPFIVKSKNQETVVLGTEFNIDSYESTVKTTLVTGAIQIASYAGSKLSLSPSGEPVPTGRGGRGRNSEILKPSQQSTLSEAGIQIKTVDVEQYTAWRDGYFQFSGTGIQAIMQQLSRWYNIEVDYSGPVTAEVFHGRISRQKNISQVLRLMESSGKVGFNIKGRKITVVTLPATAR